MNIPHEKLKEAIEDALQKAGPMESLTTTRDLVLAAVVGVLVREAE